MSLMTIFKVSNIFCVDWFLTEIGSSLKPNHHSQVTVVQISDTPGRNHTQSSSVSMIWMPDCCPRIRSNLVEWDLLPHLWWIWNFWCAKTNFHLATFDGITWAVVVVDVAVVVDVVDSIRWSSEIVKNNLNF